MVLKSEWRTGQRALTLMFVAGCIRAGVLGIAAYHEELITSTSFTLNHGQYHCDIDNDWYGLKIIIQIGRNPPLE